MISLISYARSLKGQGRDVRFLMFDIPRGSADASTSTGTLAYSAARDKAMAGRIREAYSKLRAGRLLTLSGNVHAMLLRPAYAPHLQPPMGSHLRDLKPFSVNVMARGGEYWSCGGKACGPAKQPAVREQSGPVDMFDHGLNLRVVLPRFTIARLIPE